MIETRRSRVKINETRINKARLLGANAQCEKCSSPLGLEGTADSGLHDSVDTIKAFAEIGRNAAHVPSEAKGDFFVGSAAEVET
jgi:hypothetical protein